MLKKRYLHQSVVSDLKEKMVFVGGPRQVGKTTLAKYIGSNEYQSFNYLNWDYREDRKNIMDGKWDAEAKFLIFDEIHKYARWKNLLKGEFDKNRGRFHILVTGSARLDLYQKGGDSLLGRYHYFRLHPFSLAEVLGREPYDLIQADNVSFPQNKTEARSALEALLVFGGFPEPFLKQDARTLRRFQNERADRLVKEDIRDLESVRDLSGLQVLIELLPPKVGSKLSLNSLREDLEVSHKTVSLWMDILERFYYHFRIYPFTAKKTRSLRKEPKMYLWDWSEVPGESARFENLVASHLLKTVHFLKDGYGWKTELRFLGDTEGREVDFLIAVDGKPWLAVEAKLAPETNLTPILYFKERLQVPHLYQVVKTANTDYIKQGVRTISADKFLGGLI